MKDGLCLFLKKNSYVHQMVAIATSGTHLKEEKVSTRTNFLY